MTEEEFARLMSLRGRKVPVTSGLYDPMQDLGARLNEADQFSAQPPTNWDPAELMRYRQRIWPEQEQQMIRRWTDNPLLEQFLKYRTQVGI